MGGGWGEEGEICGRVGEGEGGGVWVARAVDV